jgi:hypothetical protein
VTNSIRPASTRSGVALAVLSAVLMACRSEPPGGVRQPMDPRTVVDAWLLCEECVDGELAAVLARGADSTTRAVAVDHLSAALLAGPSPTRIANLRQQYLESFEADSVYGQTVLGVAPLANSPDYVAHYLDNFIAVFRARAALALARIGGPRAQAVLDSALADRLRDPDDSLRVDVLASLRFARDSLLIP